MIKKKYFYVSIMAKLFGGDTFYGWHCYISDEATPTHSFLQSTFEEEHKITILVLVILHIQQFVHEADYRAFMRSIDENTKRGFIQ